MIDKSGQRFLFEYRCWESEDSSDVELWHHTHQPVTILYEIETDKESKAEVGRMWKVRFDDGFEYDVFDEELLDDKSQYQRENYRYPGIKGVGKGWHGQSYRHALSARGVKTR